MPSAATRSLVLRARNAGLAPDRIQRLTGVPPRSQRRLVHAEVRRKLSEPGFRDKPGPGRPSDLAPVRRQQIDRLLAREPARQGAQLRRRLRSEHGYQAGKDPGYRSLKSARPPRGAPVPLVRFEGVAGEFAPPDCGPLTVLSTDGTREKRTFSAGRLKYSRALHVCRVEGESAEAFLRGMESFAQALGGCR